VFDAEAFLITEENDYRFLINGDAPHAILVLSTAPLLASPKKPRSPLPLRRIRTRLTQGLGT